jgi:hypothetical protein
MRSDDPPHGQRGREKCRGGKTLRVTIDAIQRAQLAELCYLSDPVQELGCHLISHLGGVSDERRAPLTSVLTPRPSNFIRPSSTIALSSACAVMSFW